MTVLTGAVATIGSAVVLFAYLGIERELPAPPAPLGPEAVLKQEVNTALAGAAALPARAMMERARAEAALGRAIVDLIGAKANAEAVIPTLAKRTAAETVPQEELGRLIVTRSLLAASAMERIEERYGRAVVAAMTAFERERDALAFAAPLMDGVAAGAPAEVPGTTAVIAREPAWGFGSIGDGVWLPIMIMGAGFLTLAACWHGLSGTHMGTRTVETHCDLHRKDVHVEMLVSDDTPYEIVHCSVFNGGPVTCDKHCLHQTREFAHAA
jgi:hypothetical protein